MRALLFVGVLCLAGCKTLSNGIVVSGSAYVEAERPEGRAVAKVEVQYRPPTQLPHTEVSREISNDVTLGQPVAALSVKDR